MNAVIDPDQRAQVALVSRDDAARQQLRSALGEFGADVVAEQDAAALDLESIRRSGAQVVIVSLHGDSDAEVDALQPLLDDADINVVFDEATVSGQLSGWDLARWARHLAAKVLGVGETNPPRPADSDQLGGQEYMPRPGAPPTPEQMAGEQMIEEFAIEAEELADAVPTDYMPMEEISGANDDSTDEQIDFDIGGVESALAAVDAAAQVSPASVPDATADANPDDPGFELPDADFSALELDQLEPIQPVPESAEAAVDAFDGGTDVDHQHDAAELAADQNDSAPVQSDPMADTLAGIDLDSDEPVNFGSFDSESEVSIDFGADEDVARLAAQLDEQDSSSGTELGSGVQDDFDASPGFDLDIEGAEGDSSIELVEEVASSGIELSLSDDDGESGLQAGQSSDQKDASASGSSGSTTVSKPSFDFGSLDLVPMDDDEGAAATESGAPSGGTPAAPVIQAPEVSSSIALEADADDDQSTQRPISGRATFNLDPMDDEGTETRAAESEPLAATKPAATGLSRIILLGASIGGPDALRTFLSGIPSNFPALFVLAQHLESGFFGRLAEQLQKASTMPVRVVDANTKAAHGQVLVVSAEHRVAIAENGDISLTDHTEPPKYQPSIDNVMRDLADTFGSSVTAIIFSGMAGDAIEGSVYVTSKGGEVWAQDSESCVVSSMVDGARARGVVEFTGSPRELAQRCVDKYAN